uniref:hAT-like transposase RNase-H fold domain-containing protein n=1 Tax=Salix viminalis TaxID=40686 RepID=A0A6N2L7L7_SALVM
MHTNLLQLCKSRDNVLSGMAMKMMLKFEKYWGYDANQNFILYVANVLDPRFKLKYVKFYFGELADEVEDDNRHIHDVKDMDCNDMEEDPDNDKLDILGWWKANTTTDNNNISTCRRFWY